MAITPIVIGTANNTDPSTDSLFDAFGKINNNEGYLNTQVSDRVTKSGDSGIGVLGDLTLANFGVYPNAIGAAAATQSISVTNGNMASITFSAACSLSIVSPAHLYATVKILMTNAGSNITWATPVKWDNGVEPSWTSVGTDLLTVDIFDGVLYGRAQLDMS